MREKVNARSGKTDKQSAPLINASETGLDELSFILYPGFSVTYILNPANSTKKQDPGFHPVIIEGPEWISISGYKITFVTPKDFDPAGLQDLIENLKIGIYRGDSVSEATIQLGFPPDTEKPVVPLRLDQIKPTQPAVGHDQVLNKVSQFDGTLWPLFATEFEQELAGLISEGSDIFSNDQKLFEDVSSASGRGINNVQRDGDPQDPTSFTVTDDMGEQIEISGDGIEYINTVVKAPDNTFYLTDGHHTSNTFALMERGGINSQMYFVLDKDLSNISDANQNGSAMDEFWIRMANEKDAWLKVLNTGEAGYSFLPGVSGNIKTGEVKNINLDTFNSAMPNQFGLEYFFNDPYRAAFNFIRGISWDKPSDAPNYLEFFWSEELQESINSQPSLDLHTDASPYDLNDLEDYRNAMAAIASWQASLSDDELIGTSGRTALEMGLKEIESGTELNNKIDKLVVSTKTLNPENSDAAREGTESILRPGNIGYIWAYRSTANDQKLQRQTIRDLNDRLIPVTYSKGSLEAQISSPDTILSTNARSELQSTGVNLHYESADWSLSDLPIAANTSVSYNFNIAQSVESSFTNVELNEDGSASHLNYDPITGIGARFNKMPDGQLQMVMHVQDGGDGDLDGHTNGIIMATSAPGQIYIDGDLSVRENLLIVGDNQAMNHGLAAQFLKVSINTQAEQTYEIIAVPFGPDEMVNLNNKIIQERAYTVLCSTQSENTPSLEGMNLSRTLQVLNNQQLAFFAVKGSSFEELATSSIDSTKLERLILEPDGSNAKSSTGLSIKLEQTSIPDMDVMIGGLGDQAPLLNLTTLAGTTLQGNVTVASQAHDEIYLGFHKVENSNGAVLNSSGVLVNPGEAGYADAALRDDNLLFGGDTFHNLDHQQKIETIDAFIASGLWAPFGKVDSTGHTYFSFKDANLDGIDHFRILGDTTFGFEDTRGGGDRDFDDLILEVDFQLA